VFCLAGGQLAAPSSFLAREPRQRRRAQANSGAESLIFLLQQVLFIKQGLGDAMASRQFVRILSLVLLLALAACGGGNNSSSNTGSNNGGGAMPGASNPGNTGGSSSGGEYLYAVAPAANDQSTFTLFQLDTSTGMLTEKMSATIPVRDAEHISLDSTGLNAFVIGGEAPGTNMDLVKVNPTTATVTPFPGQTFHSAANLSEGDCCPSALAVDPTGTTAYVGGLKDGTVHFFTVDLSSGTWTQTATYSQPRAGGAVYRLALDATAKFLYSSQRASTVISGWSRNSSGSLTPLNGSPFETNGHTSTVSISPDGKWVFVPHYELSAFDIYALNSDGTLTLKQANIAAGNAPYLAITDPQERFLYVSNSGGYSGGSPSISEFKFDSTTGAVTPVSGSPFTVAQAQRLAIDPGGKFLYTPGSNVMGGYTIDQTTGALTPISGSFPLASDVAIVKQ
jgi:6-phosphogluconolactonase (cycloisomerase 2 family)